MLMLTLLVQLWKFDYKFQGADLNNLPQTTATCASLANCRHCVANADRRLLCTPHVGQLQAAVLASQGVGGWHKKGCIRYA